MRVLGPVLYHLWCPHHLAHFCLAGLPTKPCNPYPVLNSKPEGSGRHFLQSVCGGGGRGATSRVRHYSPPCLRRGLCCFSTVCTWLAAWIKHVPTHVQFYVGSGDSNSGPQIWVANAFTHAALSSALVTSLLLAYTAFLAYVALGNR